MKNFVYGSNLCAQQLLDRVPSARYEFLARLPEHVFAFHKRSRGGSAKPDIAFTGNQSDEVWGVVADVPDEERHLLDAAEGLGNGYECRAVTVYDPEGRPHLVQAYIAEATHINTDFQPYDWYVALVLDGAQARASRTSTSSGWNRLRLSGIPILTGIAVLPRTECAEGNSSGWKNLGVI